MKKFLSAMLSLAMALSFSATTAMAAPKQVKEPTKVEASVPGELVIALEKEDASIASEAKAENPNKELNRKKQSIKKYGFDIVDSIMDYDTSEVASKKGKLTFEKKVIDEMGYVYLVNYDTKKYSEEKAMKEIKKVLRNSGLKVKYVQPNYISTATAIHPEQEWHYNLIKVPQAWQTTSGSSAVKVAVLDTGIDAYHPALRNFVNTSLGRSYYGTTHDGEGHGTHVAGTICSSGSVSGVNKTTTLIPVKVLDDSGRGSNYNISQGILYAASIGADVINMSLKSPGYDQTMKDACESAVASGSIIAAASGNEGASTVSYPAAYDCNIAVGSVDYDSRKSYFSNYGSALDIMAPGNGIFSTVPGGGYDFNSGTSMATPHVSGVLALMRAANRNISPAQAKAIVKDTATYAGSAFQYGAGIINADACVRAAAGAPIDDHNDPVEKATNTRLTSNYSYYYKGETARVTAIVTDETGAALNGATVRFNVTRPDGTSTTATGTTNYYGEVTITISTNSYSTTGTYKITAVSTRTGYAQSTANLSFNLY